MTKRTRADAASVVSIDELVPDPANVRKHPEEQLEHLRASLHAFGPGRSIVLDGKNVVRAGNATLEGAKAAGIKRVRIVDASPDELIAVRRPDWTPSQATGYAIADNQIATKATWDEDALLRAAESVREEGIAIEAIGFTSDELEAIAEQLAAEIDLDDAEELEAGDNLKTISFTLSQSDYDFAVSVLDRVREERKCNPSEALLHVLRNA